MLPAVDIVIVTYNSEHVIGGLLDSLPRALGGTAARVVVVDNGSRDGTVAVVRGRAGCRLVTSENCGYSAGINRGIAELPGRLPVLILNPDIRMGAGSIVLLVRALSESRTGIVAPRVHNSDGTVSFSLRRKPTLFRAVGLGFTGLPLFSEQIVDESAYSRSQVVDWALGACLLVSRDCLDDVGLWDESFFLFSEETDFCLRARDSGWLTRYEPSATVVHIGGQSGAGPRIHSMQIINKVRFYRRRHRAVESWIYFMATVLSETSWWLRGYSQSRDAIIALLVPSRRPDEIGCSVNLLPN